MAYWLGIPIGEDLMVSPSELFNKATYGLTVLGFLPLVDGIEPNPYEPFSVELGTQLESLYKDLGLSIICLGVVLDVQVTGRII